MDHTIKANELERQVEKMVAGDQGRNGGPSLGVEIDQVDRMESYYKSELMKKDDVIRQQREVMRLIGKD